MEFKSIFKRSHISGVSVAFVNFITLSTKALSKGIAASAGLAAGIASADQKR